MNIRRSRLVTAAAVFAAAALALTGCTAGNQAAAGSSGGQDLLSKVLQTKQITVSLNTGNAPWNSQNTATGQWEGFGISLMNGFATQLGVKVKYQPLDFASIIPSIQNGKADMIVTNLSRTVPRSTQILYTAPVGSDLGVAVVKKGSPFHSIDDIKNSSSAVLTTETGTVFIEQAKTSFPGKPMKAVSTTPNAIAALQAGRANVFLTDDSQARRMDPAQFTILKDPPLFIDSYAFGVKLSASSYTFVEAFNNYMTLIKLSGEYNELYKKWLHESWEPNSDGTAL